MALRFDGRQVTARRGLKTQTDLANALRDRGFGTTQTTVSRWESGQEPRRHVIDALASELGCKARDLYTDDEAEAASMAAGSPLTPQELEMLGVLMGRLITAKVAA